MNAYRSFLSLRTSFYVLSNSQQATLLQIPCVLGKLLREQAATGCLKSYHPKKYTAAKAAMIKR